MLNMRMKTYLKVGSVCVWEREMSVVQLQAWLHINNESLDSVKVNQFFCDADGHVFGS